MVDAANAKKTKATFQLGSGADLSDEEEEVGQVSNSADLSNRVQDKDSRRLLLA